MFLLLFLAVSVMLFLIKMLNIIFLYMQLFNFDKYKQLCLKKNIWKYDDGNYNLLKQYVRDFDLYSLNSDSIHIYVDIYSLTRYGIYSYRCFLIINIDRCLLTKTIIPLKYVFFCYLIRCLSQHKSKFWTGIRQKISYGMVLVGIDSLE